MERDAVDINTAKQDIGAVKANVERIDERTKATNNTLASVEAKVDRLIDRLLDEPRSFRPAQRPSR